MGEEHVLQFCLSRVRVESHEDDDDHAKDVRHIRCGESETEEKPDPTGGPFVFRQDECNERGCEYSERIDSGARCRDDDSHLDSNMLRSKRQTRSRRARDCVNLAVHAQGVQNGIDKILRTKTAVPKGGTILVFKLQ